MEVCAHTVDRIFIAKGMLTVDFHTWVEEFSEKTSEKSWGEFAKTIRMRRILEK